MGRDAGVSLEMRHPKSVEELWMAARDKLAQCPVDRNQIQVIGSTEAFADLAWRVLRLERILGSQFDLGEASPICDLPWHSCERCQPEGMPE